MATKLGMFSVNYESFTVPVGRDRKIRIALRANQIVGFVTVDTEKKSRMISTWPHKTNDLLSLSVLSRFFLLSFG